MRLALLLAAVTATQLLAAEERPLEFNRDIRPILSDTCFACHGPDKAKRETEMRLDTEAGALADLGDYRPIVPGKPEESEVWKRITSTDPDEHMPPKDFNRQLTAEQIETLRRWIEQGAKYQTHWSFIPPVRPALPATKSTTRANNAIDHFILSRLEQERLDASPQASKETLIRRVTLDLTGLPPTLEEVDAFLADSSPDAYERVVDRLLASPRYGERMVLEWLDAARYADSNGYQTDGTRAMWPWRDWVIAALNANMPFDRFTVEQLAGDLLPNPNTEQRIATGLHRNHMLNGEGGRIAEESRVEYVVDRVETTSAIWLGLTLGCARCHDHKYDPVSQREFYQLYAYFNTINETGGVDRRSSTAAPTIELPTAEQTSKISEQTARVKDLEKQLKASSAQLSAMKLEWEKAVEAAKAASDLNDAAKLDTARAAAEQIQKAAAQFLAAFPARQDAAKQLDAAKKQLTDLKNSVLITMVMEEMPKPRETHILVRGAYDAYGEKVTHGTPAVLTPLPESAAPNRLSLARWLIDPAHPLTARVTVNREWQKFFGTGLVKTAEDFGVQGEPPSHPQLLDWLAIEFRESWDVKRLQRLLVTSSTYRQSSRATPELIERDPENRLLARASRYRLNSHLLRDQALAASGLLMERVGGPPVKPYQPAGIWEDLSFDKIKYVQDHGDKLYRRSLYTFWRRSVGPTTMFDTATRQVCAVRTPRTNTPLQALTLLNDPTFVEASRVLAQRAIQHGGSTAQDRLTFAFRLLTSRAPKPRELEVLIKSYDRFLKQYQADRAAAEALLSTGEYPRDTSLDPAEHAAYAGVANLLLNLDEVLSKE